MKSKYQLKIPKNKLMLVLRTWMSIGNTLFCTECLVTTEENEPLLQ